MNRDIKTILDHAAAWHVASDHDDMDWRAFADWLEADPRHRAAYDEISLADAAVREHAEQLSPLMADCGAAGMPANDDTGNIPLTAPVRRWAAWSGGAIAASLLALAIAPQVLGPGAQDYATGAKSLVIALDDGSEIRLAPNSRLTVEGRNQEELALAGGAWFDIRHNPSRPMTIHAGAMSISDIGTSFDVQATPGQLRVEVAQGEVTLSSQMISAPVRLVAGHAFRFDHAAHKALTVRVDAGSLGEWREGRLSYDMEPLGLVATDLSRYAGVDVTVAKGIQSRQFSGTLATADGTAALRDLAQLMGLELRHVGDSYRLESPGS